MSKNNKVPLQEIIREEYKKCVSNPIYFMKKYVKIQHPIRGTINFNLYEFQERTLENFSKNDFNIILKSRQMGISTLVSAYSLWLMIFNKDKNVLVISIKQEVSKEIVSKVRFANDNLPSWLKVKCIEDNRLSLKLANGSQITATSSSTSAGRSQALSLLILDECLNFSSNIYIRNKKTGEIKSVAIGELYENDIYK
jgi:phage terminase large subunit-like protein